MLKKLRILNFLLSGIVLGHLFFATNANATDPAHYQITSQFSLASGTQVVPTANPNGSYGLNLAFLPGSPVGLVPASIDHRDTPLVGVTYTLPTAAASGVATPAVAPGFYSLVFSGSTSATLVGANASDCGSATLATYPTGSSSTDSFGFETCSGSPGSLTYPVWSGGSCTFTLVGGGPGMPGGGLVLTQCYSTTVGTIQLSAIVH